MPHHAQWEVGRRSMFCIQRICVGLNTVHTTQQCPSGRKHAVLKSKKGENDGAVGPPLFSFLFSFLKNIFFPLRGPENELLARIYVLSKLAHCG